MSTKTISTSKNTRKNGTAARKAAEYVIPLGGTGWVVRSSEAKKFTAIANSKREAVQIARLLAKQKGRKVIVFAKDGTIQQQFSYAV
jgi:hypothetical protein